MARLKRDGSTVFLARTAIDTPWGEGYAPRVTPSETAVPMPAAPGLRERWSQLVGLGKRARWSKLACGRAPGLVVVLLFCAGVLVASFRDSDRYYAKHLVAADTSYYLMSATLLVSGKNDFKLRQVLRDPAPLHSSDYGTDVYVLQTLAAWYLRAFLPLRPSMAVLLNGIWFVSMAVSVYSLLWSRMAKSSTAALATISFLLVNPYLTTTAYGLTSMDPNLIGFMLGTSVLACTVLSDRFERVIPSMFVGVFLGALCLGRIYTLGIVAPAMLPFIVSCFWRRSAKQMVASLQGGFFALCVACSICSWWLFKHWRPLLTYPSQYGTAGVLSHSTLSEGLFNWLHFPGAMYGRNIGLVCVLSWPLAMGLFGPERSFKRFNWGALWAAVIPLLVLAKMGTTFQPYGTVALFGVFLVLILPFATPDPSLTRRNGYAAALWLTCALSCWTFFGDLYRAHDGSDNKHSTVAALEVMRDDAVKAGRKRVTLGLVHWGTLHDASLVNTLIFDLGLRVATPAFQPKRRAHNPLIVDPLALDNWAWDPQVSGAAVVTPEAWAKRLINEADYVIVLAGVRGQGRHGRWRPWLEASELIRNSPVFDRLGAAFYVGADGPLELLVRKQPRRG